ncbi:hypothetical protein SDC9_186498 [bioreactor metagenome]|uniref:Uncharacterized protein n=1 Tax=bioreactor metagenome TaxID=1076179 RepID=A0A645HUC3_9ZZZZ
MAAMRHAVDHQRAHSADAFPAIRIEGYRVLACRDDLFVNNVEHLEEGHVLADTLGLVGLKMAGRLAVPLPPNFKCQIHL